MMDGHKELKLADGRSVWFKLEYESYAAELARRAYVVAHLITKDDRPAETFSGKPLDFVAFLLRIAG